MTDLEGSSLIEQQIGPVTILFGEQMGKYPQGNSMLIRGESETVLVDPCLGVIPRAPALPPVNRLLFSHVHEDHLAAAYLFMQVPWHAHEDDLPGLHSLDGFMAIYGLEGSAAGAFRTMLVNQFNYTPNKEAKGFTDADRFDLGGVRITVVHTPGHTRGHSCFIVDWDGSDDRLVYLGDIDLTGFGPYYGDAWSNLEDFEKSIDTIRSIDANYWLTFHHKGLYDDKERMLVDLGKFEGMIADREKRLLEYLEDAHGMDEIVAHRFVYRPGNTGVHIDNVERRSMLDHLVRLERNGCIEQLVDGRYKCAGDR